MSQARPGPIVETQGTDGQATGRVVRAHNQVGRRPLNRSGLRSRVRAIAAFVLFDAWLLSFAYQGQVLEGIYALHGQSAASLAVWATALHGCGLLLAGWIVRTSATARRVMGVIVAACLALSVPFFFTPSWLWTPAALAAALLSGIWNAAWGFCYRDVTERSQRVRFIAAAIAASTTLMIVLNVVAVQLGPTLALSLATLALAASLPLTVRLPVRRLPDPAAAAATPVSEARTALRLLYLFILVLTVSSGLTFAAVNPAFAHHVILTSWYWSVPYVIAVVAVALLPRKIGREYLPYPAVAMLGAGFLAFMILDRSAASYLVVNTLILGALGIFDLFWWSTLGKLFQHFPNPARVLGGGLAVNLLGVLLGMVIAPRIDVLGPPLSAAAVGLLIVFGALTLLPLLHGRLAPVLWWEPATTGAGSVGRGKEDATAIAELTMLTDREREVLELLLRGYTYQLVAKDLFISESTVKTHVQSVYAKLGVHSKTELIELLG